jgi:hypothetical protein
VIKVSSDLHHRCVGKLENMNWDRLLADNGVVTPQQISDFDHMRKDKRETLTLFQRPIDTLRTFFGGAVALVFFSVKYIVSHAIFLYVLLPTAILWLILDSIPGPYTDTINRIEFAMEFVVWWTGLGILSSVGLGSGLQSGVLFLFPHIIKVSLAAQTCKTLDFDSYSDMWFRSPPGLFQCPPLTAESTPVTLLGTWQKIILVCFLQSSGTAIGEIPPYWMTRAARLAAIEAGIKRVDGSVWRVFAGSVPMSFPHLFVEFVILKNRDAQVRVLPKICPKS